jgi:multiple sugar transport system permease protein
MKQYFRSKIWNPCILFVAIFFMSAFLFQVNLFAQENNKKTTLIKIDRFFDPNNPELPTTRRLLDLMKEDPQIEIEKWGGISLPGGGKASLMMAIAGKTAPDIGLSWFHIIRNEIKQGFLFPMNEWIGEDKNGNGQIDDDEVKWEPWKKVPLLWRRVATEKGKIYGIPLPSTTIQGLIFRVDMVKAAGLNPNAPPKTWDELIYWCQKLTDPNKVVPGAIVQSGQRGIALVASGWQWLPWIQSQGGDPIIQTRKSPKTGKKYEFSSDAVKFITPTGEDLSNVKPVWHANFASPKGLKAADLIYRLRWMKWMIDPKTKEPINLTQEDIDNGYATFKGRKVEFTEKDIIKGVARGKMSGQRGVGTFDLLGRGEVAITFASVADLNEAGNKAGIDPNLLSWFPYPAGPGKDGKRVVQIQNHYYVMYEGVGDRPKWQRDKVWETITALADEKTRDNAIIDKVLSGLTRFVPPKDLKRLGYEEYIREIPQSIRQNFKDMENGNIGVFTEPWMGFWFTMDVAINREVLGRIIAENGEDFEFEPALAHVEKKANSGVMFETPKEVLDQRRPFARVIFTVLVIIIIVFTFMIVRAQLKKNKSKEGSRNVYSGWLAWSLVAPALILIGLWRYYPLIRGMFMAFQDYKITGDTAFVGLDNFIVLAYDKSFWMSLLRTCYFVFLNMLLAFTAPIVLAVLLTEVPRFKIFFRTLFFLPQMTSGLVIALLWKLMYNPTPAGFFNQLISYLNYIPFLHIESQNWLEDPKLAMICCVLPTVWASMGMASLIYLAALHSVPSDLYEAAEVDGAGIFSKIRQITIPTILPLIIINFVGAFIGTFQNMGNIFLLTFGGPGEATTVVGLKIWIEAYNNLRFSMATSMAWVLGSLLIGFTYFQIQFLNKVEYRKAKD